ncbi:MAG: nuclear transport factor 2 family protein [Deltaproteobacteria bacterium]|nr:nuclear transport factor 2 family protein [Deltaproteobacteria bacterium]
MAKKMGKEKGKKKGKKVTAKKTANKKATSKKSARKPAPKPKARSLRPAAKTVRQAVRPAASPPRPDPLRELAKRIVDLTTSGNDDAALALYAEKIESAEGSQPATRGLQALRDKFAMWHSMVRNASWKARTVATSSNSIVVEWTGTVTFNATGKTIDLHEVAIHDVENGKIVRERFYYDPGVMQAAMMPAPTPVTTTAANPTSY